MITFGLGWGRAAVVCFAAVSVACLAGGGSASQAFAQAPTQQAPTQQASTQTVEAPDKTGLLAAASKLGRALAEKRYGELITGMPPRLLPKISERSGIALDVLRPALEAQMTTIMAESSIDSFIVDGTKAEFKALPNGKIYALLPTEVRMTVQGSKGVSSGHTIGIIDDGMWYLVRLAAEQAAIFRDAYPEYADIEVPKDKLEFTK